MNPPDARSRKRDKNKKAALVSAFAVAVLSLLIFQSLLGPGGGDPGTPAKSLQGAILAVLTALNVVVLILIGILLCRYVVKSLFEKRGKTVRTSVRTKLIGAFLFLSIVPTALFVFFTFQVVNRSVHQWFSTPAEQVLRHSEEMAQAYYDAVVDQVKTALLASLQSGTGRDERLGDSEVAQIRSRLAPFLLDSVLVLDSRGGVRSRWDSNPASPFTPENARLLLSNVKAGEVTHYVENHPDCDVVLCFSPAPGQSGDILVFARRIADSVSYRAFLINEAFQDFVGLKNQVDIIRFNYIIILVLAGLVILFMFVWFGLYISKKITVPVAALLEGSKRLAAGDLATPITCEADDEFDVLIRSFNGMASELGRNRALLEEANDGLTRINRELERRNTFIETVLDTIATGVVSIDENHVITISNSSAGHLLKQRRIQDGVSRLSDVLPPEKAEELASALKEADTYGRVSREIVFRSARRSFHFAVTVCRMKDAGGAGGHVIVFDDITDLIRQEKAAAWQEVARRLAHEIKNPLTPIQLWMERVWKQMRRLRDDGLVPDSTEVRAFDDIVTEALGSVRSEIGTLTYLVEEFSRFARLPAPSIRPESLNAIVEEAVARQAALHAGVVFRCATDPAAPLSQIDAELVRRVLVNLLDNAVDAVHDAPGAGRVDVETRYDAEGDRVLLTVADDGKGIPEELRERLFQPYFSTKDSGMGLGLAIVKKILDDHDAGICVEAVEPRGTRFTLEFRNLA